MPAKRGGGFSATLLLPLLTLLALFSCSRCDISGLQGHSDSHRLGNGSDPSLLESHFACGTRDLGTSELLEGYKEAVKEAEISIGSPNGRAVDSIEVPIRVPIVFSVIHATDGTGKVDVESLENQVEILSKAYGIAKISFEVHTVRHIQSDVWFTDCEQENVAERIRSQLVHDPKHFLNIVTCYPHKDILGWSNTFPHEEAEDSQSHVLFLNYNTIPGASRGPFSLGHTAVHEIGHYFGLLHTFNVDNSCDKDADDIEDTPIEAVAAYGCPVGRDSCPDSPGEDPVSNFMDYSFDSCMSHFTPLQAKRMRFMISQFRPSLLKQSGVVRTTGDPSNSTEEAEERGALTLRDYLVDNTREESGSDWDHVDFNSLDSFLPCKTWTLQITPDMYPAEISFRVVQKPNSWDKDTFVIEEGTCQKHNTACGRQFKLCKPGYYLVNVTDAGKDGFCCSHGRGWWALGYEDEDVRSIKEVYSSDAIFEDREEFAFQISEDAYRTIPNQNVMFRHRMPAAIEGSTSIRKHTQSNDCECKGPGRNWAETMLCSIFDAAALSVCKQDPVPCNC
mmetsp:Transcript_3569/g.8908  ORF Transcript_3569/g.8908 Transcript_3569/m.8908 type:complete len:562 (+) Transcript_3569:1824-3509(+)